MADLPSGTVTFLFTDIESSTRLWEVAPDAMRVALARHDQLLYAAIDAHHGSVFSTGGDGFGIVFARTGDALAAATEVQAALTAEPWPEGAVIRVRLGLHTGEVEERNGNYFGPAVNRAARIMAAGHGGQVLVSAATAGVAGGTGLVDLGEYAFAGLTDPEPVFQLGAGEFPPLRSVGAVPSNLPAERSMFVGRERELAVAAGLVRSARVVTLTGVGGVGKTRLAIQTAAGMTGEFPGGVWLVELAPLIDAALVALEVASAVGAPPSPGLEAVEVVCRFLAHRRALVVLDNCEHVVDAAAALVDRLQAAAPRTRVLATSREPLGVAGESVWRVPSLSVETPGGELGDAVTLFVERASQVRPDFTLDNANGDAVVAVCRRLDGIPLAIELAAARTRVMSVEQIASRLDERFRLLTRGGRTAVARQQTLQGAIDWSYELLASAERELFDVLGVFAGDFDLRALAAVAGIDEFELLDLVAQLADKSMLEVDPAKDRYRLLETLREYAWDRLVATDRLGEARDAHATYYSRLAGEQAALMGSRGRQVAALDRLEIDYDNLRAALAHLIEERQAEAAVRMVRRLVGLFNIRHPREGVGWFRQVVAIADDLSPNSRARLLGDAAFAAMASGDLEAQGGYAQISIDIGGNDAPGVAYWVRAQWLTRKGDFKGAVEQSRRGIAAATAAGDVTTQVCAIAQLILALATLGNEPEIRRLTPEAVRLAERLGNPTISGAAYSSIGEALALLGHPGEAAEMFKNAFTLGEAVGPIVIVFNRSAYALVVDDPYEAARILCVAVPVARRQLSGFYQLESLVAAAKITAQMGQSALAARLLGAYKHHHADRRFHDNIIFERWYDRLIDQLTRTLGVTALDEELRRGDQMTPDQALQLALEAITDVE
jgi:predicted ATPase/class 3 adenylate cyclase